MECLAASVLIPNGSKSTNVTQHHVLRGPFCCALRKSGSSRLTVCRFHSQYIMCAKHLSVSSTPTYSFSVRVIWSISFENSGSKQLEPIIAILVSSSIHCKKAFKNNNIKKYTCTFGPLNIKLVQWVVAEQEKYFSLYL